MILRPRRLAVALATGRLTEREKFHYLLISAVIGLLVPSQFEGWSGWTRLRAAFVAIGLLITLVGLVACFRANARGDDRAFLERYLCLSVPLGIATYVLYVLLYYGLAVAGLAVGWVETDVHNWNRDLMSLVSSMGALALFFVWMRALIMTASGARVA